ncbi:MAG: tRNA (adenosine(37)-N6)-threonylcarbamoyltransferase complex ATPase subunit type 1 TsaE [Rhodobacteraceae bacterium]|nr:tRNA (adenosine(37)-N6)-threonylcarbamoyltransferase complex ATPase subunit type 1 TsaE [Paracoccaceae bacterium]
MTDQTGPETTVTLTLHSPEATVDLARQIAADLGPGDTLLLDGPIGAGKSHFCRAAISSMLAAEGRDEDVPSPTFTLVQTYELAGHDVWHVDLYRLGSADHVQELGLADAFEDAVVFVEWPDRLGGNRPDGALDIAILPQADDESRQITLTARHPRWRPLLAKLGRGQT